MSAKETNEFSVQEIKSLMEAMRANRLAKITIKKDDFHLEMEGAAAGVAVAPAVPAQTMALPMEAPAVEAEPIETGTVVKAPIVGTFYAAAGPDRDPYVQVGSAVKKGDVLFIIESMKLMNEVTSDVDGVVTKIMAENAQGVEYGQPILVIE